MRKKPQKYRKTAKNVKTPPKNRQKHRKIIKNVEKQRKNIKNYKKSSEMSKNWKKVDKSILKS